MASSGRWSIQLIVAVVAQGGGPCPSPGYGDLYPGCPGCRTRLSKSCLLRRPLVSGHARIAHIVRIEPGAVPAVFVVFGEALLGERDHAVHRSGRARVPERLDADV